MGNEGRKGGKLHGSFGRSPPPPPPPPPHFLPSPARMGAATATTPKMAAPHGTKRYREHDDPNEGRRPTKITVGDTENYPVLWSDITQLPRLCWSLRDVDRRRSSNGATPTRNIAINRVSTSSRSHSVAFPAPEIHYLRDLQPSFHTNTRPGAPRRSRFQDDQYSVPRPTRPAVYGLIHEQHLLDHRMLLPTHPSAHQPLPADLEKCVHSLKAPITFLTTSSFPPQAFHEFLRRHDHLPADDRLLPDGVLDTIAGRSPAFPANNIYVAFNGLKPVNDISDIIPVPYAFDGVRPSDLEHMIRDKEEEILVTTKRYELPVAPNFFFEIGRRDGMKGGSVRAAAVDGAYGARGMYVLKTYGRKSGRENGEGDGEALAFSATYDDEISSTTGRGVKVLRLYAHHVTAGSDAGEDGEDIESLTYNMTELGSWEMTSDYEEFLKGATAFRNLRLWAAMVRIGTVDEANYRVSLEKH